LPHNLWNIMRRQFSKTGHPMHKRHTAMSWSTHSCYTSFMSAFHFNTFLLPLIFHNLASTTCVTALHYRWWSLLIRPLLTTSLHEDDHFSFASRPFGHEKHQPQVLEAKHVHSNTSINMKTSTHGSVVTFNSHLVFTMFLLLFKELFQPSGLKLFNIQIEFLWFVTSIIIFMHSVTD
jgi:hypothetical protein